MSSATTQPTAEPESDDDIDKAEKATRLTYAERRRKKNEENAAADESTAADALLERTERARKYSDELARRRRDHYLNLDYRLEFVSIYMRQEGISCHDNGSEVLLTFDYDEYPFKVEFVVDMVQHLYRPFNPPELLAILDFFPPPLLIAISDYVVGPSRRISIVHIPPKKQSKRRVPTSS